MTILIVGLLVFLGVHAFATMRATRMVVIDKFGEGAYKGVFSLISFAGLALIVWGFGAYRAGGYINVWDPPAWTRHLAMLLVWLAFIMIVAAYTPIGKIKTTLRHPMLVGIKTWALAHLLANGDLGSMILFGAFLAWAVYDRISVKRRGEGPAEIVTSVNKGDGMAVVIGSLLFGLMFWLHPKLIGVSFLGT